MATEREKLLEEKCSDYERIIKAQFEFIKAMNETFDSLKNAAIVRGASA